MCGRIQPADSSCYGSINGALPDFLVIESLAQLSGLLMRELGLTVAGQVGYLVSVSGGTTMGEWCDTARLLLQKIPGVGLLTATAAVATMGDAKAFKSWREFAAWLGLVPRQTGTGGRIRMLGIGKRGVPTCARC